MLAGTPPADNSGKPIRLNPKLSFHERITGLKLNAAGTFAAIGYKQTFATDENHSRVVMIDLTTKKVIADRKTRGEFTLLALSDDGRTVLMRRDGRPGNNDRLELWQAESSKILKGPAWIPYGHTTGTNRDIEWAAFAGPEQLLTCSHKGVVTAWSMNPISPLWTCETVMGSIPALSPSRRYLAVASDKQLSVINLAEAKVVAARSLESVAFPKLSFSPGGSRLAMFGIRGKLVLDAATGEIYRDIDQAGLTQLNNNVPLAFVSEDQVLAGGNTLVDLPSLVGLWRYSLADEVASCGGASWFAVSKTDREAGVLFGAKLPHPAAVAALDRALADPNYFVVRPGCKVKLNLESLPDAAQREEVRQRLTQQLTSLEMQVDASAPVELSCRLEGPQAVKLSFTGAGEVDFNETISRLEYTFEGQKLWSTSGTNRPFMIQYSVKDGVQASIRKYEKVSYGTFLNAKLPRMVPHPAQAKNQVLGESQVTTAGIR